MDKVELKDYQSKYFNGPYPMIYVNGMSLDTLLDSRYPDQNLYGLVPAATWLWDADQQALSIDRFLSPVEASTFVPLLVCPDDADFSCTILIVEIENSATEVFWRRVGIDASKATEVGTTVKWLQPNIELRFSRADYDRFREELVALAQQA